MILAEISSVNDWNIKDVSLGSLLYHNMVDFVRTRHAKSNKWWYTFVVVIFLFSLVVFGCPLTNLQQFEEKIYSQNGEDGILIKLLLLIGSKFNTFVEFGVEHGEECNSRILREYFGFQGLMMDGDNENEVINLRKEFITESNVLDLFAKYSVSSSFDVLSLDVDMFDYWILARILGGAYRPRIIVVETNPTLCVNKAVTTRHYSRINALPLTVVHPNMTEQSKWDLSRYAGANPTAFQQLGQQFGYEMVYCERCGVNCFLVLRSEMPQECQSIDFPLPLIPYPCFGTLRTGGAYPGHEYDPLIRDAVVVSQELLTRIVSPNMDTGVTMSDVQASMMSCDPNATSTTTSWLIEMIQNALAGSGSTSSIDTTNTPDTVEIRFTIVRQGEDPISEEQVVVRASLCDDRTTLTQRCVEFCQRVSLEGDTRELDSCRETVEAAMLTEMRRRAGDVAQLCPTLSPDRTDF